MSNPRPLGDLADIILTVAARSEHRFVHPLPVAAGKDRLAIGRAIASLIPYAQHRDHVARFAPFWRLIANDELHELFDHLRPLFARKENRDLPLMDDDD